MYTVAESSELQEDAELVIEVLSEKEDIELDYSVDSISWLDGYIDEHRGKLDAGDKSVLREKLGAFLGESIRRNYGGRWVKDSDDSWKIVFDEDHQTSPFDIIGEHLDHHGSLSQTFEHLPDMMVPRRN
ncbi:MAG: hypothetical protein OXN88_15020 [Chloroflexota bacterium]|nr:hypothetical protein [Chloroflexota bacterium]